MDSVDSRSRKRETSGRLSRTGRARVLFVIPSMSGGGGSQRILAILLRSLDRQRFEPIVLMTGGGGDGEADLPADVPTYRLGATRSRYAALQLVRRVWQIRPDAIFSMALHLSVLLAMLRPFLPRSTRVFARQNTNATACVKDRRFRRWRRLIRIFYSSLDCIICQTDEMLEDLASNFSLDRRRLIRIYNPIDQKAIQSSASGSNPYRGNEPHLVCAGRLDHVKGFDVLLQAIGILKQRSIAVELTILGEGEEEKALRQLAQDLDISSSVHFLGFQANPYVYFKNADAFVLSSRYEGLSNAMLEAACLAVPIIAIDVPGGAKEALRGSNAVWIAPRHNSEDLAKVIAQCIRELPGIRTSGVRHPMIQEMQCDKIIPRYEEVLSICFPA
jgi:glycosyltransferase involved in cell wall biosynthesis